MVPRTDSNSNSNVNSSNNGKGELVRVALALPGSGERIQLSVPSSTTLRDLVNQALRTSISPSSVDILKTIEQTNWNRVSIVYMRTTVNDTDLVTTTLANMGILHGAVSLRLNIPTSNDSTSSSNTNSSTATSNSNVASTGTSSATTTVTTPVPSSNLSISENNTSTPVSPSRTRVEIPHPSSSSSVLSSESNVSSLNPLSSSISSTTETLPIISKIDSNDPTPSLPSTFSSFATVNDALPPLTIPSNAPTTMSTTGSNSNAITTQSDYARIKATGAKVRTALGKVRMSAFDQEAVEVLTTVLRMLDALVQRPGDLRIRSVRLQNPNFHSKVGKYAGGADILRAVGFKDESTSGEAVLVLPPEVEDDEITLGVREMVALEASSLGAKLTPAPEPQTALREAMAAEAARIAASFDPFRAVVLKMDVDTTNAKLKPEIKVLNSTSVTESSNSNVGGSSNISSSSSSSSSSVSASLLATASTDTGLTVIDKKVLALKAKAMEIMEKAGTPDRNTRIILYDPSRSFNAARFTTAETAGGILQDNDMNEEGSNIGISNRSSSSSSSSSSSAAMVVDDDAQPGDSKLQMDYMRKKLKMEKEKEEGFRTKAMRELEQLQKAKVYTSTMIRIQTPDRTVLQGNFSPLETLSAIYTWVRSLLVHDTNRPPFFIYSTPPPTVVIDQTDKTLADARLQPAVLLYLGWGTGPGARATDAPVDANMYLSTEAYAMAKQFANSNSNEDIVMNYPTSQAVVNEPNSADVDAAAAALLAGNKTSSGSTSGTSNTNKGKGKPSWLKL